jgi:heterodisulfide reductase subunit B
MCCGAPTLAASEETALQLAKMKLDSAKKAGADCLVTVCPFCEVMFDTQQLKIASETGQRYDMPALFYPQLLGLSMGFKPDDVGLGMNRIPAEKVLDFLSK